MRSSNLIVKDEVVRAVLDFDELNYAPLAVDIAQACHYLAGEAKDLTLPRDKTATLLAGYQSERPLKEEEVQLLPRLFELVNLVDAAAFLKNPPDDMESVEECRSLQIYKRNMDFPFRDLVVVSR
jgi:Ser/Thr protein kinase RdoA (MazF antagonist)